MLYSLIRPLLFLQDTEASHRLTLSMLDRAGCLLPERTLTHRPVTVMGITFPNRVGLAAGLDKNGAHVVGLGRLGFGFLEVGTVTPVAQAGNPQPRLFRLPAHQAIINRMGFNNDGVDALVANVSASRSRYAGVLGINIGKNKDTPNDKAVDDYLLALRKVYPHADYITANISSPNTVGLRELQSADAIKSLLERLKNAQAELATNFGYKPIAIKIAPDLSDDALVELADIFKQFEIDGIIATNTTIDKSAVAGSRYSSEEGGLSGVPVRAQSTHVITVLANALGGEIPIIGVGGISSGADALEKLRAGASLVQLYSGLIYRGPSLVNEVVKACAQV